MQLHSSNGGSPTMHNFRRYNLRATTSRSTVATLGAPQRSTLRRMCTISGGACTGRKHENWSSTYVIMKICGKALGVSW